MALNDKLITIADVRVYRDISANYDTTRFNAMLLEIENIDLRRLLGDEFWYDFFINISATKYQTLLTGESYTYNGETIYYFGLKLYLIWKVLTKIAIEANVHHGDFGNKSFIDPANLPSKWEMNEVIEGYKSNALECQNNIIQYLNEKSSTYTLWDNKNQRSITSLTLDII